MSFVSRKCKQLKSKKEAFFKEKNNINFYLINIFLNKINRTFATIENFKRLWKTTFLYTTA